MKNSVPDKAELKAFRLANGLTQSQVADLLHLSIKGICNYEQGIRRIPAGYWELLQIKAEILRKVPFKGIIG